MKSFNEITLPTALAKAIADLKFTVPTPIQAAAIPIALSGKDVLGCAQTGTGKTAAFSIPMIAKIISNPGSKALVLTPTRELANQVAQVVQELSVHSKGIRQAVLIGGASMRPQMRALSFNPSVIIATPGRLTDHLERGSCDLSKVTTVILDEADRMLDMGFAPQVERVFKYLPNKRQTLLFSATLAPQILKLAQKFMQSPEQVSVGETNRAVVQIKQSHIVLPGTEKNDKLLTELKSRTGQVLVFARTKIRTDRLAKFLKTNSVKAAAIHGGRTQSQRERALDEFRNGYYRVLVATDVASRGIDIPMIELVVNFDLPQSPEDYIHRIGRTARAGANGEALSFVTPEETNDWKFITKQKSEGGHSNSQPHKKKSFARRRGGFARFFKKSSGQKSFRGR